MQRNLFTGQSSVLVSHNLMFGPTFSPGPQCCCHQTGCTFYVTQLQDSCDPAICLLQVCGMHESYSWVFCCEPQIAASIHDTGCGVPWPGVPHEDLRHLCHRSPEEVFSRCPGVPTWFLLLLTACCSNGPKQQLPVAAMARKKWCSTIPAVNA